MSEQASPPWPSVDMLRWRAYVKRKIKVMRRLMPKHVWGKKVTAGEAFQSREGGSGRFIGRASASGGSSRSSAGSALNQTERVAKALKSANEQTRTFKPKNAR